MTQMSSSKRKLLYTGLILLALPVAACNTVKGVGKDVKSVGNAVGNTVEEGAEEAGEAID